MFGLDFAQSVLTMLRKGITEEQACNRPDEHVYTPTYH